MMGVFHRILHRFFIVDRHNVKDMRIYTAKNDLDLDRDGHCPEGSISG